MIVTNQPDSCLIQKFNIKYDANNTLIFQFDPHSLPSPLWTSSYKQWLQSSMLKVASTSFQNVKIILNMYYEAVPESVLVNLQSESENIPCMLVDCNAQSMGSNHLAISHWFGTFNGAKSVSMNFNSRTKHFVCLNRNVRYHRIQFVNLLLQQGIDQYGTITLGVDPAVTMDTWIDYIDPKFKDQMPLQHDFSTKHDPYDMLPFMQNGFINVVTETSFEIQSLNGIDTGLEWNRILISEKTMKAFWMKQLPLFLTVPGHVAYLRSKGIIVFDDFIDHSYDTIEDPNERIHTVFNELKRLCNIPLDDIKKYCLKNTFKFEHNINQSLKIARDEHQKLVSELTNFLN